MSMEARAGDYLAMRRSLGFKLRGEGRMLADFARRLDEAGQATVTISAALAWATESQEAAPAHRRRRLSVVRGFARHLATLDPACQIPPADLLAAPSHRPPPYIYSAEEIAALVHAAGTIGSPLPSATLQALISLIAATGLRLGEALALDRDDAGLDAAMLTVTGKNDQMRLVPLHPTTAAMLAGYAARRDRLCPHPASPAFFITSTGQRAQQRGVQETFARLVALAGIAVPPGRRRPGVHDLRHTFAVTTLTRWYRDGADVQAQLPVLSAYLGHSCPAATYWYLQATPELLALAAGQEAATRPASQHRREGVMTALAPIMEAFFTDRLMTQRGASPHTIASYRDTFTLLLGYIHQQAGKLPAQLDLADLDPATIAAFLQQLETSRGNSAATRNARLAAIRSLFRYASLRAPEHAALISRVLAIQPKRTATTIVSFLTPGELDALLAAPDRATWHGRRDHALLVFAAQTGLRVSELTGLAIHDVHLGAGPHAYCRGKGRKDRATPLTPHTVEVLAAWLAEQNADPAGPLFATRTATPLSRDAIQHLVTRHAATAARACPSLRAKNVTPHTLRHSAAMNLLHAGVDITVIALWLGHESPATTRIYLHADMALKEKAIARTAPPDTQAGRYQPPDELLAFLSQL